MLVTQLVESYNHQMVWVGRDLKDHLVPTSLPRAGTPSSTTPGWNVYGSFHEGVFHVNTQKCPSGFQSKAREYISV